MIARTWTAVASPEREASYLQTVRDLVLPELRDVSGYRGARFMRRVTNGSVDVLVVTYWESMDAIAKLTDGDPDAAYVPDAIATTLERFDTTATHYDVVVDDAVSV